LLPRLRATLRKHGASTLRSGNELRKLQITSVCSTTLGILHASIQTFSLLPKQVSSTHGGEGHALVYRLLGFRRDAHDIETIKHVTGTDRHRRCDDAVRSNIWAGVSAGVWPGVSIFRKLRCSGAPQNPGSLYSRHALHWRETSPGTIRASASREGLERRWVSLCDNRSRTKSSVARMTRLQSCFEYGMVKSSAQITRGTRLLRGSRAMGGFAARYRQLNSWDRQNAFSSSGSVERGHPRVTRGSIMISEDPMFWQKPCA
jgi:hypothetical protein